MNHILSLDELDIPFECQVQDMDDDDLLNLWEHSQSFVSAIQNSLAPGVTVKSAIEDNIVCELMRREYARAAGQSPVPQALGAPRADKACQEKPCQEKPLRKTC
ncbi:MAG: hypothetical protein II132_08990 [Desulfovibrio sp.]|jgi:hypothetical protein|nr:hypothetical protein [Desulfovibrio sp.]MBQ1846056.1 hypothetical protein [Desulfovibrio sp.]MBQ2516729.1 hypothetical protein [Desulfovibrio sp.]